MKRFRSVVAALAVGTFLLASAQAAGAWETQQSAQTECNADGPGVVVKATFENTEPANRRDLDMKVSASFEGVPMMLASPDDIAESGGGTVSFQLALTQYNDLLPGRVKFDLKWADGHKGTDVRYATTNRVVGCLDIVEPDLGWGVAGPNCGDRSFPVNIFAEGGNAPVVVKLLANDVLMLEESMSPDTTKVVDVPVEPGQAVVLELFAGNRAIDVLEVQAPTAAQCHIPAPSADFNGRTDCEDRVSGMLRVNRDGLEGDIVVVINDGDISAILSGGSHTLAVEDVRLPISFKLTAANGMTINVDTTGIEYASDEDCPEHPPVTNEPPTPPSQPVPPSAPPALTELPNTGSGTMWLGISATVAIAIGFVLMRIARSRIRYA